MVASDKIELVSELTGKLKKCQSVVIADFKGITVHDVTILRSQLRAQQVEMRVMKNRLIKRALAEVGFDALDKALVGNSAIALGYGDPSAAAKILLEAAKKNDKVVVKGGLLEGKALDAKGVETLSKMPGRKDLLTMMARDFKQPATKMATVFQASLLKVAYAMQALGRKKDTGAEAA